ncbi:hypothetical protein C8J56DRAFT_889051 [Mycena floridula]|nr:hypothetical protein C8J56DRAFT_889051 [Mycena floridula]
MIYIRSHDLAMAWTMTHKHLIAKCDSLWFTGYDLDFRYDVNDRRRYVSSQLGAQRLRRDLKASGVKACTVGDMLQLTGLNHTGWTDEHWKVFSGRAAEESRGTAHFSFTRNYNRRTATWFLVEEPTLQANPNILQILQYEMKVLDWGVEPLLKREVEVLNPKDIKKGVQYLESPEDIENGKEGKDD